MQPTLVNKCYPSKPYILQSFVVQISIKHFDCEDDYHLLCFEGPFLILIAHGVIVLT